MSPAPLRSLELANDDDGFPAVTKDLRCALTNISKFTVLVCLLFLLHFICLESSNKGIRRVQKLQLSDPIIITSHTWPWRGFQHSHFIIASLSRFTCVLSFPFHTGRVNVSSCFVCSQYPPVAILTARNRAPFWDQSKCRSKKLEVYERGCDTICNNVVKLLLYTILLYTGLSLLWCTIFVCACLAEHWTYFLVVFNLGSTCMYCLYQSSYCCQIK